MFSYDCKAYHRIKSQTKHCVLRDFTLAQFKTKDSPKSKVMVGFHNSKITFYAESIFSETIFAIF